MKFLFEDTFSVFDAVFILFIFSIYEDNLIIVWILAVPIVLISGLVKKKFNC